MCYSLKQKRGKREELRAYNNKRDACPHSHSPPPPSHRIASHRIPTRRGERTDGLGAPVHRRTASLSFVPPALLVPGPPHAVMCTQTATTVYVPSVPRPPSPVQQAPHSIAVPAPCRQSRSPCPNVHRPVVRLHHRLPPAFAPPTSHSLQNNSPAPLCIARSLSLPPGNHATLPPPPVLGTSPFLTPVLNNQYALQTTPHYSASSPPLTPPPPPDPYPRIILKKQTEQSPPVTRSRYRSHFMSRNTPFPHLPLPPPSFPASIRTNHVRRHTPTPPPLTTALTHFVLSHVRPSNTQFFSPTYKTNSYFQNPRPRTHSTQTTSSLTLSSTSIPPPPSLYYIPQILSSYSHKKLHFRTSNPLIVTHHACNL